MHVFLNCLSVELTFMWEFTRRSGFDCIVDEFRMLANQFAKFFKYVIVHFLHSLLSDHATTLWLGMSRERFGPAILARAHSLNEASHTGKCESSPQKRALCRLSCLA